MERIRLSCGSFECPVIPFDEENYDGCFLNLEKIKEKIDSNYVTIIHYCACHEINNLIASIATEYIQITESKFKGSIILHIKNTSYIKNHNKFHISIYDNTFTSKEAIISRKLAIKDKSNTLIDITEFRRKVKPGSILFATFKPLYFTQLKFKQLLKDKPLTLLQTGTKGMCENLNTNIYRVVVLKDTQKTMKNNIEF
jgi:ribosomal protein S8